MLIELYCLLFFIVSTVIIIFMNITSFYLMLPIDVMLLFSVSGFILYVVEKRKRLSPKESLINNMSKIILKIMSLLKKENNYYIYLFKNIWDKEKGYVAFQKLEEDKKDGDEKLLNIILKDNLFIKVEKYNNNLNKAVYVYISILFTLMAASFSSTKSPRLNELYGSSFVSGYDYILLMSVIGIVLFVLKGLCNLYISINIIKSVKTNKIENNIEFIKKLSESNLYELSLLNDIKEFYTYKDKSLKEDFTKRYTRDFINFIREKSVEGKNNLNFEDKEKILAKYYNHYAEIMMSYIKINKIQDDSFAEDLLLSETGITAKKRSVLHIKAILGSNKDFAVLIASELFNENMKDKLIKKFGLSKLGDLFALQEKLLITSSIGEMKNPGLKRKRI